MITQADWQDAALMTRWERLSEKDVARIGRDRARLVAALVDLYGWSPREAETEVAAWERDAAAGEPAGAASTSTVSDGDTVVQASEDSFPASDPPGWIKQAPRAPKHASAPPKHGAEQPAPAKRSKRKP
jgi:hypothetical protein